MEHLHARRMLNFEPVRRLAAAMRVVTDPLAERPDRTRLAALVPTHPAVVHRRVVVGPRGPPIGAAGPAPHCPAQA